VIRFTKGTLLHFPLSVRKRLTVFVAKNSTIQWLPDSTSLPFIILRDWAEKDADSFHRFLWSHHLAYAKWLEKCNDFAPENLRPSRKMLLEDLKSCLIQQGMDPKTDIKSVFDVGCSAGFLLRYMEINLFPAATILEGNDIDGPAIERGEAYLRRHNSKIRLVNADMAKLDGIMGQSKYDIVLCAAVLVYLHETAAAKVVGSMLNHCKGVVAIYSVAHPIVDNSTLEHSETRSSDRVYLHNIDAMVKKAGGAILYRRWEGSESYAEGKNIYFVFCKPAG